MDLQRRLSLLVTSPRVAPGLLSHQAWQALEQASGLYARNLEPASTASVVAATGYEVHPVGDEPAPVLARRLVELADAGRVVWVGSLDADPHLAEALASELAGNEDPPELEMLIGSWDVPGARLLDAVTVMDRLRSPGGCPWDAAQTHDSLVPYLIEETYECVEALESGDREHALEELGDVLLQVLFHARVAEEAEDGYDIDDIAAALVDKLIRRHPHVFAAASAESPAAVQSSWSELKRAEKPDREHPVDGIPAAMPDLARAAKVTSRLTRAGHGPWLGEQIALTGRNGSSGRLAAELLGAVVRAQDEGIDPGRALRQSLRSLESASREIDDP